MNAKKRIVSLVAGAISLLGMPHLGLAGYTLDGGVTINGNGGAVGSGADTTVFRNGAMTDLPIHMVHNILEANSGFVVSWRTRDANATIVDYFTTIRTPNTCYLGENESSVGSVGLWDAWHSPGLYCSPPACDTSPIILDLGRNGFQLSGSVLPVEFDIDADGSLDQISWTAIGTDEAFLCFDRNRNGRIDDGEELFGNATPLAAGGRASNGFQALAEFDSEALGGNGDGRVDSADVGFDELCVWRDANRDANSQPNEMRPLTSTRIRALEYGFQQVDILDQYGNTFWLESTVWMARSGGQLTPWPMYDVMFVRELQPRSCLP